MKCAFYFLSEQFSREQSTVMRFETAVSRANKVKKIEMQKTCIAERKREREGEREGEKTETDRH
jgi:hypothetical protein